MLEPVNGTESLPRSLERYSGVLKRQWWVTLLITVVAVAAAVIYVERATPVYSASAKIVVGQEQTLFNPALSVNYQAFTSTISSLLQSNVVAEETIQQVGLHTTPTHLLSNLNVSAQPDGAVIQISYNDPDRARAVRVLSALGSIFTALVNTKLAGHSTATPGTTASPSAQPVSAVIFDPSHADPGLVSPHRARSVAIALVLGLVGGLVLAFLRDALSSTVTSEDEVEALYGATSLGSLPRGALGLGVFQVSALPRKLNVRLSEAVKMVAARLRYSSSLEQGVIVITSARPEDGKSTVAAHLAAEFASAGKDVIAVEADLHRPALHRLLDLEPGHPGITDLLASNAALVTNLVTIGMPDVVSAEAPSKSLRRRRRDSDAHRGAVVEEVGEELGEELASRSGRLRFLAAGGRLGPRNAGHALSLGNASSLVMRLRSLADYVIVDTPPLLLSGDAYPLLQLADAVVIVSRRGTGRAHEIKRTAEILDSLGVSKRSVIFTESTAAEREYYSYES